MSQISQADFARTTLPMVNTWIQVGLEKNRFNDIKESLGFKVEKTDSPVVEDMFYSGMGTLRQVSDGEAGEYDRLRQLYAARYRIANYRLMISITENMIADGKALALVEKQAKGFGRASIETHNVMCANILNRAFSSSYTGADGKELCATDHPTSVGVSNSNELASPTALSEAALEQMFIEMGDIVDDRGLKLNVKPKKLIVPRDLIFTATRILSNIDRPATADRDINALVKLNMFPGGVVQCDYLTSATAYFVETTEDEDGLKFFERKPLTLSNEPHFSTDSVMFKAHERFGLGWSQPFQIFGTAGA